MYFFEYKISKIFFIIALSFSNMACAENIKNKCELSNVVENVDCLKGKNKILKMQLDVNSNSKRDDFNIWSKSVEEKCEGRKKYTLGEGAALIREQCYNNEYINRLKIFSLKKSELTKGENVSDDGFLITYLPYHSDDHIKCLLNNNKKKCDKLNLISVNDLLKVYNFLDPSSGASVIFPETKNGVILIALPSSSESGGLVIDLVSVNALGLTKKLSLDASKNIIIDKNFNISFLENGKIKNIIMSSNGDFIQ